MKKDKVCKAQNFGSVNDGILITLYLKFSKIYCKDIQPD